MPVQRPLKKKATTVVSEEKRRSSKAKGDVARLARARADQKSRLKILEALEEVGPLLTTHDSGQMQQRAIAAIIRLARCEGGALLLIDPVTREIYFNVALGKKGDAVKVVRLMPNEGVAGWVARTGESLIVNDVRVDPRFSNRADERSGYKTRNLLAVPMTVRGHCIGVLEAVNKVRGKFNELDMEGMTVFANQIAIAVENNRLYETLQETFLSTASALGDAIEAKDAYTAGHTRRVMEYSLLVAQVMRLPAADQDAIRLAATLHDIGKIGIEDRILKKPGRLDPEEMAVMRGHSVIGEKIVAGIPKLRPIIPGIRHHHEQYDGKGYPDGLLGEAIPKMARIIAVCDTFDAMTSDRPYRRGLSIDTALQELHRCTGTQFDPHVVQAFQTVFDRGALNDILRQYQADRAVTAPVTAVPVSESSAT